MTNLERAEPDRGPEMGLDLPRHRESQVVLSYAGQFHYSGQHRPEATGAAQAGTMAKPGGCKVSDLRDARRDEAKASACERVLETSLFGSGRGSTCDSRPDVGCDVTCFNNSPRPSQEKPSNTQSPLPGY